MSSSVLIGGVEYVPRAQPQPPAADERLRRALRSLVDIQRFPECSHKHRAWAWDVLNALDPDLARLASEDPRAAFEQAHAEPASSSA